MMICDQNTYDVIYTRIIQAAIVSKLTEANIRERNDAIRTLRLLCRGQKSSYETGSRSMLEVQRALKQGLKQTEK